MSANDSSTLIDTPAASKLGENRALYYSEEANRIEKFRPYGVPELEWLEDVKKRFDARPRPASTVQPGVAGMERRPARAGAQPTRSRSRATARHQHRPRSRAMGSRAHPSR